MQVRLSACQCSVDPGLRAACQALAPLLRGTGRLAALHARGLAPSRRGCLTAGGQD